MPGLPPVRSSAVVLSARLRHSLAAACIAVIAATAQRGSAQTFAVPSDARVIDASQQPFSAIGDGVRDDTAAIQAALDAAQPNGAAAKIVYLPPGTYRLSDRIEFPTSRITLQGGGQNLTTLRLDDGATGFDDPSTPRAVLSFRTRTGFSANQFRNWAFDLSIDSGSNNPGAVGIKLHQNNTGGLRHVHVRSTDRQGVMGIDINGTDKGPGLLRDVTVVGFDRGVAVSGTEYGMVFEGLTLREQNVAGFDNLWNLVALHNFTSVNSVPAILNRKATANDFRWGNVIVIDANLSGGASGEAAIHNEAALYLRNVQSTGYSNLLRERGVDQAGSNVSERILPRALSIFPSPERSLGLPIQDTPEPPTDPVASWANVEDFGADGTASGDDAAGIQAAIDSGATTVYLPSGRYELAAPIVLRGAVRRLIAFESRLASIPPLSGSTAAVIQVDDAAGAPPLVLVERVEIDHDSGPAIEHNAARDLVLRNVGLRAAYRADGPGRSFIEDVVGGPYSFAGGHSTWARQLNPENPGTKISNFASDLWILGIKTEKQGTIIDTRGGGRSELLGNLVYPVQSLPIAQPMFISVDSATSALIGESAFGSTERRHEVIVEETRAGVTRRLHQDEVPRRVGFGFGAQLSLYAGFGSRPSGAAARASYSCEGSSNSLIDTSPNGANGSLSGPTRIASGGLAGSGALSFDGVDDAADLPADLVGADVGAVSLWLNAASPAPGSSSMLFYAAAQPGQNGFGSDDELHLALDENGRATFFIERGSIGGSDLLLTSRIDLTDGTWHHVVASWDNAGFSELFVDGRRVRAQRLQLPNFRTPGLVRLGRPGSSNERAYAGLLDEVQVYDRALRHEEVLDLFFGAQPFTNYPPSVTAGPDRVVQDSSFVGMLQGQARDDGQPTANLSTAWTQSSGPGTTSFANPSSPATAATFSGPGRYELELSATDGATTVQDRVTVDVFAPLPAPWVNADIGSQQPQGWMVAGPANGSFDVVGSGNRIGGNPATGGDGLHFAHQDRQETADLDVIARITAVPGTDPEAIAGVCLRSSDSAVASQAIVGLTPTGLEFRNRAGTFGGTATAASLPGLSPPLWLRIQRTSTNRARGSYSDDGLSWIDLGEVTVNVGRPAILAGLAVCSGDPRVVSTASYKGTYVGDRSTQAIDIGSGCIGTLGQPPKLRTAGDSRPATGGDFNLVLIDAPTGAPAAGFIGFSTVAWNGTPLPLALDLIGMTGCSLLVSADISLPPARAVGGQRGWRISIANDPGLLGLSPAFQALIIDPGANTLGVTTSQALRITIGEG